MFHEVKVKRSFPRRKILVALALAALSLSISSSLLILVLHAGSSESSAEDIVAKGLKIANYYEIGRRNPPITKEEVRDYLSLLPGFGEAVVEQLVEAASTTRLDTMEKLMGLTKETKKGPARLLTEKQLTLLAALYKLPPR